MTISNEHNDQEPRVAQTIRPNVYIDQINFVTKDNPLDAALIDYQKQISEDETPTQAQQKELIISVRQGDDEALKTLLAINKGFIAAVAYPYQAHSFNNFDDLINIGEKSLIEAAITYDIRSSAISFTNFAASLLDKTYSEEFEWGRDTTYLYTEKQPMLSVYRFMSTLVEVDSLDKRNEHKLQDKERLQKEILLRNADWLQYLNLPNNDIEQKLGIDISMLYKKMKVIQETLLIPNRSSLALACLDAGITFNLPELPEDHSLTAHQRTIASLLHLDYESVAALLGTTFNAIDHAATAIRVKLHARSRTELVLMTRVYELGPEPDRTPEYLTPFSQLEREVMPYIHLNETESIMQVTGLTKDSIDDAVSRMLAKTNTKNRRELALYLHNCGYEFEVSEPEVPLHSFIKTDKLTLFQNLHLPDEELADISRNVGLNPNSIHHHIALGMKKTGARSRIELQLMALKYADGLFENPEKKTKQERLAEKLGLAALDRDYLEQHIDTLGTRQANLIRAYYFSAEDITWRAVAKQFGFDRTLSIVTASKGVVRLKRRIDEQYQEKSI